MKKKNKNKNKELEDTIIDYDFKIPILTKLNIESNHKIISFISEYMSLSLKEKIVHYLNNKSIRAIVNPLTTDTLLHYLCTNDDNLPLIKLMKPTIKEIETKNNLGQSLLHITIINKCIKISKFLIEKKADLNSRDNNNCTPLHIAVEKDDFDLVKLLVDYNAKINLVNNMKESPIDLAQKKKNKLIINYLENKRNKNKNNLILNKIERYNNNDIYESNICNEFNKINLGEKNISINNYSDETKNETENQSLNVYKKKVLKTPLLKRNKSNRAISLNLNVVKPESIANKNVLNKCLLGSELIYRRNTPRIINKKKSFKELLNNDKNNIYNLNLRNISPKLMRKNSENLRYNPKDIKSQIRKNSQHNQNSKAIKIENILNFNEKSSNFITNENKNNSNFNSNLKIKKEGKNKTRNNKQLFAYYTYNNPENNQILNNDRERIIEFLKEIGMQKYSDMLISEGYDDIDLIIKQMNIGFPSLYDTLKEIGIISPGDRTKILIHLQENAKGFNFEFPFEQVYFKNNRSIQKWLNNEGLSKYINNFLDAGYQSFELLLIQMASKYKINEKILREEISIFNEEDIKKILKSLEENAQKYVYQLKKNHNVQRTYSKMVSNKNSETFCNII